MDYGNVLCWATNPVGRQSEPCVYHIIPAGKLPTKIEKQIPPPPPPSQNIENIWIFCFITGSGRQIPKTHILAKIKTYLDDVALP